MNNLSKLTAGRAWGHTGVALVAAILVATLARADAPAGRYTTTADTVTDTKTGLTWQRAASTQTYSWSAAAAYCTGGWRLPRIKELQTLVDVSRYNPAIDTFAFPGTPAEGFWSSSPDAVSSSSNAWLVYFSSGFSGDSSMTGAYRVRCVR